MIQYKDGGTQGNHRTHDVFELDTLNSLLDVVRVTDRNTCIDDEHFLVGIPGDGHFNLDPGHLQ